MIAFNHSNKQNPHPSSFHTFFTYLTLYIWDPKGRHLHEPDVRIPNNYSLQNHPPFQILSESSYYNGEFSTSLSWSLVGVGRRLGHCFSVMLELRLVDGGGFCYYRCLAWWTCLWWINWWWLTSSWEWASLKKKKPAMLKLPASWVTKSNIHHCYFLGYFFFTWV